MKVQGKEFLIASMVGSRVAETMPRLSAAQNEVQKYVTPVVPFLPFQNVEGVDVVKSGELNAQVNRANASNVSAQCVPLKVKRVGSDDPWFTFPYEPLISITGKNNIVKRSIAKAPDFIGTVKEHWSQDDYTITITGFLFGDVERGDFGTAFPHEDFESVRDYCTSPTGLQVECELLQKLGINYIVVEDFSFPFSKGENVQAYDIKAVSDWTPQFFLEITE